MHATTFEIRTDLSGQPYQIIKCIQEGLVQAQQNEFVPDEDMDAFFACYAEPQAITNNPKRPTND